MLGTGQALPPPTRAQRSTTVARKARRSLMPWRKLAVTTCGKVIDFDQCTADQIADELAARYGFTIHSHLLEFYGRCASCRNSSLS